MLLVECCGSISSRSDSLKSWEPCKLSDIQNVSWRAAKSSKAPGREWGTISSARTKRKACGELIRRLHRTQACCREPSLELAFSEFDTSECSGYPVAHANCGLSACAIPRSFMRVRRRRCSRFAFIIMYYNTALQHPVQHLCSPRQTGHWHPDLPRPGLCLSFGRSVVQ